MNTVTFAGIDAALQKATEAYTISLKQARDELASLKEDGSGWNEAEKKLLAFISSTLIDLGEEKDVEAPLMGSVALSEKLCTLALLHSREYLSIAGNAFKQMQEAEEEEFRRLRLIRDFAHSLTSGAERVTDQLIPKKTPGHLVLVHKVRQA